MASLEKPSGPLTPDVLEERLRSLAQDVLGDLGVDDLEMKHLLEIMTRSSRLLREGYDPRTLDRILSGARQPASLLETVPWSGGEAREERPFRIINVPDVLRNCGDKCLYDVGFAGRTTFRGFDLQDLGPRSYSLASRVLALLGEDPKLRDFYDQNLVARLPIDEEILFLRQCASRFQLYAQVLKALRGEDAPARTIVGPGGGAALETAGSAVAIGTTLVPVSQTAGRIPEEDLRGLDREERLARYERALLLSTLDVARVRARMKEAVVDQPDAVDRICDDLSVFALGTRGRPRPQSYLLVGPTGVGKNHLIETLVRLLEEDWGVEVPFLVIEGPQYTYPSDVSELKGSTRGFIRSDEEGLLSEFHEKARAAPLSFLLVDEIEKAHPQLTRFFLALMDRGSTMDNKGRLLRFPATILAYTSNLGYSEEQMRDRPIGYGAERARIGSRRAASRNLKRGLPPEFLNRLKVIHFAPLARRSAARILDQEVARIAGRYLGVHGIDLQVTAAARAALLVRGFSEEYGARNLVAEADRVCNVEVSLRLHEGAAAPPETRRLLARIREARRGGRVIDEEALRSEVARQTRLGYGRARVRVDWSGGRFVYGVERG